MPVYTVHEPPRRDDDALGHAMRFRFVRDGFHFWAFLLAPLWMLRHRLWIELIAYLLLLGGVDVRCCAASGSRRAAGFWVWLFLAVLVGMEASIAVALEARAAGFEQVGIVVGDDREEAERRFFDGWEDEPARPAGCARRLRPRRSDRRRPPRHPATSSACSRNRRRGHDGRDRRLRLGQPALGGEGLRARGARVRSRSADPGDGRSRQGARRRPRGAARRRRLRGLPPRARCGARHGRGAERDGARRRAGRSSASASACS